MPRPESYDEPQILKRVYKVKTLWAPVKSLNMGLKKQHNLQAVFKKLERINTWKNENLHVELHFFSVTDFLKLMRPLEPMLSHSGMHQQAAKLLL